MSVELLGGIGLGILAILGLFWKVVSGAKKQGQTEGKVEVVQAEAARETQKKIDEVTVQRAEESLDQMEEANAVRDRLQSDPAYADSVRSRFTRPD